MQGSIFVVFLWFSCFFVVYHFETRPSLQMLSQFCASCSSPMVCHAYMLSDILYISLPCFYNFFSIRPQQLHEVLGTVFALILRSLLCYSELRVLMLKMLETTGFHERCVCRVHAMHVVPRCWSKNVNHLLLRSGTKSRLLQE